MMYLMSDNNEGVIAKHGEYIPLHSKNVHLFFMYQNVDFKITKTNRHHNMILLSSRIITILPEYLE